MPDGRAGWIALEDGRLPAAAPTACCRTGGRPAGAPGREPCTSTRPGMSIDAYGLFSLKVIATYVFALRIEFE